MYMYILHSIVIVFNNSIKNITKVDNRVRANNIFIVNSSVDYIYQAGRKTTEITIINN